MAGGQAAAAIRDRAMPVSALSFTGMSVNTPLGDTLDAFHDGLLAGKSALSRWKCFAGEPVYSKVGADLSDYDVAGGGRRPGRPSAAGGLPAGCAG